ncbi:MAG: hypothetical protein P1S60_15685 [Anaerolineae bacterium]|nr:hypothetical protein [Anaerolineae bacterium]
MVIPIRVSPIDDDLIRSQEIQQFLEYVEDIEVGAEGYGGAASLHLIQMAFPDVAVIDIRMLVFYGVEVTRWNKLKNPNGRL